MKTTLKILALLIGLSAMACTDRSTNDYNPQLPPETQTGAWTFGCKINGQIMIPQDATLQGPPGGGLVKGLSFGIYGTEARFIEAKDAQHGRGAVAIKIPNSYMGLVGTFSFEEIQGGLSVANENKLYMGVEKNNRFYDSMKDSGKITFTRNDSKIISGTFHCKLKNKENPNDIIEITEGRFDLTK